MFSFLAYKLLPEGSIPFATVQKARTDSKTLKCKQCI